MMNEKKQNHDKPAKHTHCMLLYNPLQILHVAKSAKKIRTLQERKVERLQKTKTVKNITDLVFFFIKYGTMVKC